MTHDPAFLNAGNAGTFTLDGTRTYRVGTDQVVLLDPGPDVEDHVRALASWVADASDVRIALTHGHGDHAGAAPALAEALGVPVVGPPTVSSVDTPLQDGERVETDDGVLVAVHTPGHTEDHLSYHWLDRGALFVGDLMLGQGDTTWVAEYPGCVRDYLASLQRVRALAPRVLYPSHGPPLRDAPGAVHRYERHRTTRIRQVAAVLARHPEAFGAELLEAVYGDSLPAGMEGAALRSVEALVEYVKDTEVG